MSTSAPWPWQSSQVGPAIVSTGGRLAWRVSPGDRLPVRLALATQYPVPWLAGKANELLPARARPPGHLLLITIGNATVGTVDELDIYQTSEVAAWLADLQRTDPKSADLVDDAIYALSCSGPALGRPLVDTITGSALRNLKELRPGSTGTSEIRILFAFDPWRSAILLVAGDKAGKWKRWYAETIPRAEHLYEIYLKERTEEDARR